MQDLNDKITGNSLTAAEWNEMPTEIQNIIEDTGQTLSGADLDQLGKGVIGYVSNGNFYTDSGSANAYVLTQIGNKQAPTAYVDGMQVEYIPGATNTTSSTVNVAALGVKNIVNTSGGGEIVSGTRLELRYRLGSDDFEIISVISRGILQQVFTSTNATTASTVQIPHDNTIPQITEGFEVITRSITPGNTTNRLLIRAVINYADSGTADQTVAALFQDTTVNALTCNNSNSDTANNANQVILEWEMAAGTTSSTTFRIRIGGVGATVTLNGGTGTNFGGALRSTITITEFKS